MEIEEIMNNYGKDNIEAIYSLSTIQQGLLFHALHDPESQAYLVQHRWKIEGDNWNKAAFKQAWERVIERHPILRTAFVWEQAGQALQVVRGHVELPWRE